jgi:hypothetical protein
MTKYNTDLVAHREHIAEDLYETLETSGIELTEKQIDDIIKFVQVYMHVSIEAVIEYPAWFKNKK